MVEICQQLWLACELKYKNLDNSGKCIYDIIFLETFKKQQYSFHAIKSMLYIPKVHTLKYTIACVHNFQKFDRGCFLHPLSN